MDLAVPSCCCDDPIHRFWMACLPLILCGDDLHAIFRVVGPGVEDSWRWESSSQDDLTRHRSRHATHSADIDRAEDRAVVQCLGFTEDLHMEILLKHSLEIDLP